MEDTSVYKGEVNLTFLHMLIDGIFLPLLDHNILVPESGDKEDKNLQNVGMNLDFMNNFKKFNQHISHIKQQLSSGSIKLEIPDIHIDDPREAAKDEKIVQTLETALEHWTQTIRSLLEQVQERGEERPSGVEGPLAEIEEWRKRAAVLGTIYEQLDTKKVKQMIEVLRIYDAQLLPGYDDQLQELTKLYSEAKTLERHFKGIAKAREITPIGDSLLSMMNAISMVWVISRHYNKDKRMLPLMSLIANAIADKVEMYLNIKEALYQLFDQPDVIMKKLLEAISVLNKWKSTYYEVRRKLEEKKDERWEFDKDILFERTTYMTERCQDLYEIAEVIAKYKKFLGPELRNVTGDTKGIDEVLNRVKNLLVPFQNLKYNIFDKRAYRDWKERSAQFHNDVEEIKALTNDFIDKSFKKLRSAEGAFRLLQDVKNIQSQENEKDSINQKMMLKSQDILERFKVEINNIYTIFLNEKDNPPKTKNLPTVAGAIYWSNSLFQRIRKPMLSFASSPEMLNSELGVEIKARSYEIASEIKKYEDELYKNWESKVTDEAVEYLKRNILAYTDNTKLSSVVNFHPRLMLLIQETKYLDKLGRKVPEVALNVTLQEEKYHSYVESLKLMLENFDNAIKMLDSAEYRVLRPQILKLQKTLRPGYEVLNWNSLGIPEFIKKCNFEINEFQSTVKKIKKNAAILRSLVNDIRNTILIKEPNLKYGELMDLQSLYKSLDQYKKDQLVILTKKYKTIGQTLLKIEGDLISSNVIVNTQRKEVTGREELLQPYYTYWEKRVFKALARMVVNSLALLQSILNMKKGNKKNPAVFRVVASLSHTAIVINPDPAEILKMVKKIMKNVIESTKNFTRWMHGTCHEITHIEIRKDTKEEEDMNEIIRNQLSFYPEIVSLPAVVKMQRIITLGVEKTIQNIQKYVDRYLKFEDYWKMPKEVAIEKFAAKEPTWDEFDDKLEEYSKLVKDIQIHSKPERVIDFVNVDCKNLLNSIQEEARGWINALGELLNNKIRPKMEKLYEQINSYKEGLHKPIESINDLRSVLSMIDTIRVKSMDVEREYREIEDCYNTLKRFNLKVPEDEAKRAQSLSSTWNALLLESAEIDKSLVPQKQRFTQITVQRVQEFKNEIKKMAEEFEKGPGRTSNINLDEGLEQMYEIEKELEEKKKMRDYLLLSEKLFNLPLTSYPDLHQLEMKIETYSKIYGLYAKWKKNLDRWSQTVWSDINLEEMKKETAKFMQDLQRNFDKDMQQIPTHTAVRNTIKQFRDSIPLFEDLKSDALRKRHWQQLMDETGVQIDETSFTLQNLLDMKIHEYKNQIHEIVSNAKAQLRIENLLKDIAKQWRNTKFSMKKHIRDNKDRGYILQELEPIKEQLEEGMTNLAGIAGTRHVVPFIEEIKLWEQRLSLIEEVMEVWIEVQRTWIYLEIIFIGSVDIREQLPKQAKDFDKIDAEWNKLMTDTAKNRNVLECCSIKGRLQKLQELSQRLADCQKELSQYLQTKRDAFPRFYFISDPELLSILGTSDPTSVQEHMMKMFENCNELIFKNNKEVIGMISKEGESFNFRNKVVADTAVEKWLNEVDKEMQKTLKAITKEAVFYYPQKSRVEWIKEYLGMVGLCGSQIWWTWQVEDAFQRVKAGEKMAVKNLSAKLTKQLNDLVDEVRTPLQKNDRAKITTMIIIDVHARDIVDNLVRDSIIDERDFEWESQLRFYWVKSEDTCKIRQCTGEFEYGFEYMGLNGRLVITPLTDRCFMTLTQALTFKLGGSPAGPAGTGKTESVKDLAKSLGIRCVVFNCGEGLDHRAMHKIFAGLCQSGSWGCFDEFNRIELPVLSVTATQIRSIQNALRAGVDRFRFEESDIKLDPKIGIFVTMNPGYAGRVELPDNLKTLFRPCVMVVPDMEIICEIMLFSEGFNSARILARKMTKLYSLAKGQLSKQHHYDWGLRALKAVLVMAGRLKRQHPENDEMELLMNALRDMNAPKFVFEDVPLFTDLLSDLFVNISVEKKMNERFAEAIRADLEANNYEILETQVTKVIQLYETMGTRHAVMVVGGTCGGKSVVIQTLKNAQTARGFPTKLFTINPKAQTVTELYGVLDEDTRDWKDGLLSFIFREINRKGKENERRYIVFDGDVDAVWVENMNSVMDDSKILTLPNAERISLNYPQCALLFEVGNLQYASPATVSRCGMVYVDPKNLGYKPYIYRWLQTKIQDEEKREVLQRFFDKYCEKCIQFVLKGKLLEADEFTTKLKTVVPVSDITLVMQLCCMLDTLIGQHGLLDDESEMESLFVFAVVWSIGGCVVDEDRSKFDKFLKQVTAWQGIENGAQLNRIVGTSCYPERLTMYEYFWDISNHCWRAWKQVVPEYEHVDGGKFSNILVPTVDTVRYTYLLKSVTDIKKPVLFVGASGTAKSVTIQKFLDNKVLENPEKQAQLVINFSSRTSSLDVQRTIEDHIEKRVGDTYGPLSQKHLNVFIDDLNMPNVDIYGTQQPIALLKLLIERGGFYERGQKSLNWMNIKDLHFIAAMGLPGGGRNEVDPRFLSQFCIFNISFPSNDSLMTIYSSILNAHLRNFDPKVIQVGEKLTEITLNLYQSVTKKLPPTPSKFHYIFNLRDLSRVYEGLCLSTIDKFNVPHALVRLWRNECMRVFHDRLINEEDKDFVSCEIDGLIKENFPNEAEAALKNPMVFGDFGLANKETDRNLRLYEDLIDYQNIKPIIEDILAMYNEEPHLKPMNLVMFDDALEHLTRIHRIIRMNRGHALLVGVGGSGKQSLTRLAAYTAGYSVFEITLSRGYNESNFREDLKALYEMLGIQNKKVVFLFTDAHVVNESFLEYINNMLTSGMVPALFEDDEKANHIKTITPEVKKMGILETPENCWNYFIDKCRDNLHIVLCMSPAGETLRRRCRNFPGLVNNTSIDWFMPWPEQALRAVSDNFLAEEQLPEDLRESISQHIVGVHTTVTQYSEKYKKELRRHNYVTPKNYLDFIATYRKLLKENRNAIDEATKVFDGGLEKLNDAKASVEVMKKKLSESKQVLQQKKEENSALLAVINKEKEKSSAKLKEAQKTEEELRIEHEQISKQKKAADEELAQAEPALREAEAALDKIDKNDISNLKSFATPHPLVQDVGACIVILLQGPNADLSWKGSRSIMTASFISDLKNFDKSTLNAAKINAIKRIYKKNGKDFTVEGINLISTAAAGMLKWVDAMLNYYRVFKGVEPKRKQVQEAEESLRRSEERLQKTKEELKILQANIAKLNEQFEKGERQARKYEENLNIMENNLNKANRLIDGLASERERWGKTSVELKEKRKCLIGDCLLGAAFLSYTGAFTVEYRNEMIYKVWYTDIQQRNIPVSPNFKLESILTDEVTISQWAYEGLPSDEVSIQNGILTTRASRFPLCIDPQQQAITWIKNREKELSISTFNEDGFMRELETAVKFGKAFLFENVGEFIDPMIDSVLEMDVQGKNRVVKFGEEETECDDNFKLYLTSKMSNPHYSPEIAGKTMIINYTVTLKGLTDQLLNVVVNYERAELEQQRRQLVQSMSENKSELKKSEKKLLRELNMSTGNLIENEDLINTLEDTKAKVADLNNKLREAEETSKKIALAREQYRPVAQRGAILYFVMSSLSAINSMYEYSLASYMSDVFEMSLEKSEPSQMLDGRLENIIDYLTYAAYSYTCTGLFERHKLMFSFHMTLKILEADGKLNQEELDFFLKGNTSIDQHTKQKPFEWMTEQGWKDLLRLQTIGPKFEKIIDNITEHEMDWKNWSEHETPEILPIPFIDSELDPFQKMCVLRCFRTDRIYMAITNFIKDTMKSEKYVKSPVLNYENIYNYSSPWSPIVCMISPGYDPANDIIKLANTMHKRLRYISLGQGQGEKAKELLERGIQKGHWVLLQNCHLLIKWMVNVEKIMDKTPREKIHKEFRLWLTTEATPEFPIGILQRSIKVVAEPPDSLLLNMKTTYENLTEDQLESCPHPLFKPLVFVLSFFHAVVQERRKYGKIGWNVSYDFNTSDFDVSMSLLGTYLSKAYKYNDPVPWGSLRYLVGEAMYGGRVTDFYDRRVLITYLDEYMGDFLFDTFQPFHFYKNDKVDYTLPPDCANKNLTKKDYSDYIDKMTERLPIMSSPEVFGLHPNAEIGYFTDAANNIWNDLLELQPRVGGTASGITREERIENVANEIIQLVPEPFDRIKLIDRIPRPTPIQVVLLQEVEAWNNLVTQMTLSLNSLLRALKGEIGMSSELEELSISLFNGTLPTWWAKYAPATRMKLANWLDHFRRRYEQYQLWTETLEDPVVMWLSGLHTPESYLTALVQVTCKKYKWPLDRTTLFTRVTKYTSPDEIKEKPTDGCYVHGLYLEGASWDIEKGILCRQKPKELVTLLPVMEIIPIENSKLKLQNTFKAPVYVTPFRRGADGVGLVFEADLETVDHQSHWVLQGVALFLNYY